MQKLFIEILHKLKFITDAQDIISLILLSLLTFIGLIFEVLSLVLILPFLNIVLSNEKIVLFNLEIDLNIVSSFFGVNNSLLFFSVLIFISFLIKQVLQGLIILKQKRFVTTLVSKITNKLFGNYISQKYSYYADKNKSLFIQNIQTESNYLVIFLESLINLISDMLMIISLSLLVLIFDYKIGLLGLVFFMIIIIIYSFIVKNKAMNWANIRIKKDQTLSKLIIEVFSDIKTIIIYSLQDHFKTFFNNTNNEKFRLISNKLSIDQFPKLFYEFASVAFIVGFIFYMDVMKTPSSQIINSLALILGYSYKVLPSISKISVSANSISDKFPSLNKIYNEINLGNQNLKSINPIKSFTNQIELKNVSFAYTKQKNTLDNISITIDINSTTGIIGKSGQGKTTLIDIISGLYKDFSGQLLIDGNLIDNKNNSWDPKISYVSQKTFLYEGSIKENILVSNPNLKINDKDLDNIVNQSGLYDWIKSLDDGLDTQVGHDASMVSGGQKQRIGIARALFSNSDILFFDEPTSSLDKDSEKKIMKNIYSLKGKKTIIIISHNIETLKECDKIIELKSD